MWIESMNRRYTINLANTRKIEVVGNKVVADDTVLAAYPTEAGAKRAMKLIEDAIANYGHDADRVYKMPKRVKEEEDETV